MAVPLIVFEGDSLTAGSSGLVFAQTYPGRAADTFVTALQTTRPAVLGSTMTDVDNRAATVDASVGAGRPWWIECLWIGTNDLYAARSPAALITDITSYCQARRAAGFQVMIFTITPRSDPGVSATFEADRQTVNASIRANWATYADYLLDIGADSILGGAGAELNTAWYSDKVHMTPLGYLRVSAFVRSGLQALQPGVLMAISASTVWEVRATGAGVADTNGGGFVQGSGGTDRSQQNAPQVAVGGGTVTSSVTTNVITFTGGTYTVLAGDVGNIVQVISGTLATAGFYQISSVSAGLNGTWTMDRNVVTSGTATNLVANMGGALLTLGKLAGTGTSVMILSNKAYCTNNGGAGFTSTTTTTFAQTGNPTATVPATRIIGYGSVRGDGGHATLTLSGAGTVTGLLGSGIGVAFEQIDVDCGSIAAAAGISIGSNGAANRCKVSNFTTKGITATAAGYGIIDCEVTGGTAAATAGAVQTSSNSGQVLRCHVHDNAGPAVVVGAFTAVQNCLICNNSGALSDGVLVGSLSSVIENTIHNNGRDGVRLNSVNANTVTVRDNILSNNTGLGLNSVTVLPAQFDYDGNAYFGNATTGNGPLNQRNNVDSTTGAAIYGSTSYTNVLDQLLTVSPYVGPTTGTTANFALNNTAGGGANCRGVGSPLTWPGNTGTASYPDMGACQTRGSNTSPSPGGSPGVIVAVG